MDVMALEQLVRNIDLRLTRIEQILPTLATKDDLRGFATKDELERFATKQDLERFPTKEEMREELREALREGLSRLERRFEVMAERAEGYVRLVAEGHHHLEQKLEAINRRYERDMAALDRRVMRLETR